MELTPAVAQAFKGDDPRFTKGTIKAAARWAVDTLRHGDDEQLTSAVRASDLPAVRAGLSRFDLGPVTAARVVALDRNGDPPTMTAELSPGDVRIVLRAVEWPEPQWKIMAVGSLDGPPPEGLAERVLHFPLSAEARRRPELDWLMSALTEVGGMLGADVAPLAAPAPPPTEYSTEDLGMGEYRHVSRRAWSRGPVDIVVEHVRHEIYDGATPSWSSLRGAVTGLPAGAAITLSGSVWVEGQPMARLFVTAPRPLLDRLRAPIGDA